MKYIIGGKIVHNDVQTMTQVFFQNTGFELVDDVPDEGLCLELRHSSNSVSASLWDSKILLNTLETKIDENDAKGLHMAVKYAIFSLLVPIAGYRPPWGLLTGIRPAKIVTALFGDGFSCDKAQKLLQEYYLVDHNRAELCTQVAAAQQGFIYAAEKGTSVYIGVPFCPSICLYCSFSSYPMEKYAKYAQAYVDALLLEIRYIGKVLTNKYVENIYIGGGTPTALDIKNFERLLACVAENFDIPAVKEYSIEAGRPDTITLQKLCLMKKYGVTRISINPQSLNDDTLKHIGRGHSADDFFEAYNSALEYFDNINIDLILGLAGENKADMYRTLGEICSLMPNSVTIHTLAVKRASRLHQELNSHTFAEIKQMEEILSYSQNCMRDINLYPYYMYRQKNSPGNFENVGYCRTTYEGRYNIQIMEERQNIFAAGAGAVTKLIATPKDRINRVFNLRNPIEYIQRVDEMIERKRVALGEN